ncbi:fluoride efflux transporter CrcB [Lederbergia galactosidilytica]|uniref:Fluoride-specific ion channel FluC n=1 Tax=Lederbergia galactosidilytica TaxID=217031 RepID=A0A0Q9Y4N5_9BACI|nr:fluoride efflux transporter CrcB [Lederbergia galactosidilytica]KRG11940.1 camphor resistance protein CrcB [Lederbergia galactosidilytica]KRG12628.1 camphor resistance protein CrcB [Virgibacillus soli]MBP1916116.1 CrcB protein [Lederbergia galactosidilytica]OAK68428.1 camphor resistance protein CrcB [Lederbergia galactosidilytica]
MKYIAVGIAGMVGASLRYLIGLSFQHLWFYDFPLATFLINMVGSFLLGWFTLLLPRLKFLPPVMIPALGTGLIGSFTTFSTFSVETVELMIAAKWGITLFYILLSLWGGLLFSWLGYRFGSNKGRRRK